MLVASTLRQTFGLRHSINRQRGPAVLFDYLIVATAALRLTGFMECPEWASPYCDVRRFDDRCPTSYLAFYQCCEWLLASPLFARNVAAEVGEALAYVLVIECLVECIRERV